MRAQSLHVDLMTDNNQDPYGGGGREKQPPIFNAPPLLVIMCLLLIGLYAGYAFAPVEDQQSLLFDFALAPERFWAPAGSPLVYRDHVSGLLTLVSTALLHGDWMHVIVNALMLLAFGTPVARAFGGGPAGWGLWMILFLGSVVGGSALYLSLATSSSPYAVGASGGICGLMGATFLLDPLGGKRRLWSPEFLRLTLAIGLANVVLTLVAPMLLGMGLAWEAHVGGYLAGSVLMAVLPARGEGMGES